MVLSGTPKRSPRTRAICGPSATSARSSASSRGETSSRLSKSASVSLKRWLRKSMKLVSSATGSSFGGGIVRVSYYPARPVKGGSPYCLHPIASPDAFTVQSAAT